MKKLFLALAMVGAMFVVAPKTSQAAPIVIAPLTASQAHPEVQQAQYYGHRRHYGSRRHYGRPFYAPRPHYGRRHYGPRPSFGPSRGYGRPHHYRRGYGY